MEMKISCRIPKYKNKQLVVWFSYGLCVVMIRCMSPKTTEGAYMQTKDQELLTELRTKIAQDKVQGNAGLDDLSNKIRVGY